MAVAAINHDFKGCQGFITRGGQSMSIQVGSLLRTAWQAPKPLAPLATLAEHPKNRQSICGSQLFQSWLQVLRFQLAWHKRHQVHQRHQQYA
jgi:hypothetical protein